MNTENTEGQSVDEKIGTEAEAPAEKTVEQGDPAADATGAVEEEKSEEKTEETAQA